jgi:hypothetical protein
LAMFIFAAVAVAFVFTVSRREECFCKYVGMEKHESVSVSPCARCRCLAPTRDPLAPDLRRQHPAPVPRACFRACSNKRCARCPCRGRKIAERGPTKPASLERSLRAFLEALIRARPTELCTSTPATPAHWFLRSTASSAWAGCRPDGDVRRSPSPRATRAASQRPAGSCTQETETTPPFTHPARPALSLLCRSRLPQLYVVRRVCFPAASCHPNQCRRRSLSTGWRATKPGEAAVVETHVRQTAPALSLL